MKKLILALLLSASACFATLPATLVWDVQTASGNDANGGAFDSAKSGTDASQGTVLAYTDISVQSTTTQITSSLHPFSSTSVGNVINITGGSGCTTGWHEITSVTTGTATLDSSAGSSGDTCTGNYGGPLASIAGAVGHFVSGNIAYVKGTNTVTAVLTLPLGCASSSEGPCIIAGYTSVHGDAGMATWTTTTNSAKLIDLGTRTGWEFDNITFTNAAGTNAVGITENGGGSSTNIILNKCTFSGFTNAIAAPNFGITGLTLKNVKVSASTSDGLSIISNGLSISNSWFTGSTGSGIKILAGGPIFIAKSVFNSNGADGLNINGSSGTVQHIDNSIFRDNTTSGIAYTATGGSIFLDISNSILYNNGAYGINYDTNGIYAAAYNYSNAFGANMTAPRNGGVASVGEVTLTADPNTNAAGGDFSLNSTAGGGAALKGKGFPGAGLVGTGHLDIGALQSAGGGSGASSFPIIN